MPRNSKSSTTSVPRLFAEKQTDMLEKSFQEAEAERRKQPIECLGITFPNDTARSAYFLGLLAEKLKNPEFRKVDGFPIGKDEDILALSDPPYYTACPNPWLSDFANCKNSLSQHHEDYHRDPMIVDVSVGKTDPLYKAHSYHTKVPHLAIVPSILHYTDPGDLVLDGFSGSGMTGVASQWCGSAPSSYRQKIEDECRKAGRPMPKWGARRVVLNDLSPAAALMSASYNLPFDLTQFANIAQNAIDQVEKDVAWMYQTRHSGQENGGRTESIKLGDAPAIGQIEYTVWSEIFLCNSCDGEVVFFEEAYDRLTQKVKDSFLCPHCAAELAKKKLEKVFSTSMDTILSKSIRMPKRKAVLICYELSGKLFYKTPDLDDLETLAKIDRLGMPKDMPHDRMMHVTEEVNCWGDKWRAGTASFTHIHHLYLNRAAHVLCALIQKLDEIPCRRLQNAFRFLLDSHYVNLSVQNRYRPGVSFPYNPLNGVYYVSSLVSEASPFTAYRNKLKRMKTAFSNYIRKDGSAIVSTGSANAIALPNESVDYVFTDPPFGDNLAYGELNFQVESFHRVFTNLKPEAILSKYQHKKIPKYQDLMRLCFAEYYRVLKSGRWMTVVFSNTRSTVWNGIQTALQEAGFVVANVSALDKQQGSFNAVSNPTSVKQDLVISAYKPNKGLESRFAKAVETDQGAWEFVRSHLKHLPVFKESAGQLEFVAERDPRIVYDRMIAFYFQHGANVPLNSAEFQVGLSQLFSERDGMVFLSDQATEYDRKKLLTKGIGQRSLLVDDERSAIDWLTEFLKSRPSAASDIAPHFMEQLRGSTWKAGELRPELHDLLRLNFLCYDGTGDIPSQIHSYLSTNFKDSRNLAKDDHFLLSKAKDRWYVPDPNNAIQLEKTRERDLLRDFETYRTSKDRKIVEFRIEALRAGFKKSWQDKDYQSIISVGAKIPEIVIQEDPKLLMWHSNACTRAGVDQ